MNGFVAGSAVVTGGGSGLGRAIALALAGGGTPVAVVDLFPDGSAETVALIRDKGGHAIFVEADVSRWADVDHAVGAGVRELGPLGIMVNAAGILDGYQPIDEMAPAVFERLIAINLTGTFFGMKRALAEMLPRGAGRVINLASVAGLIGGASSPRMRAELARSPVRIGPGQIAFTVTPRPAQSTATCLVSPTTPCLEAT